MILRVELTALVAAGASIDRTDTTELEAWIR
jgi:hypothetical protein